MIGVIFPSRGLVFSRTAEELLDNLKGFPHKIYFSHRKPLPDCFELPAREALKNKAITHLWFVEDDMALKPNTLQRLLDVDKAVVTADYPINKDGRGAVFSVGGQIVFTGTGCLLVKRGVFEELRPPYFRTDFKWNIKNYGDFLKLTRVKDGSLDGYGLHDVNFCMNLYGRGIPIHKISGNLGQRKLISLGESGTNNGAHNIEVWGKVKRDHLLKQVKKWPVDPKGNLTTVTTETGEITVSKSHAKTLIKKGLATRTPRRKLVVDWNEG